FGEQAPKFFSRSSQPGHNGAGRTTEYGCYLLVAESFDISKNNYFAISARQALNRSLHFFAFKLFDVNYMGVIGQAVEPPRGFFLLCTKLDQSRAAASMPKLVEPCVAHDRKQPAFEIAVWHQSTESPDRSQIRFLHQVLGFRPITSQSHCKS